MMRRLRRLAVVLGAVAAVIGLVRLVEHFGRAGDPAGELAALGVAGRGEVFDPAMVWVPLLDLALVPRVLGVGNGEAGVVADGVVLAGGREMVVGHRDREGRVASSVYPGGGGVGLGEFVGSGSDVSGDGFGWRTGEIVGEGLGLGSGQEVFLRNLAGGASPNLLKRPLPVAGDGGLAGIKIMPGDEDPETRKP